MGSNPERVERGAPRIDGARSVAARLVEPVLVLLAVPLLALIIGVLIFAVLEVPYALVRGEDRSTSRFLFQTSWDARTHVDWLAHVLTVAGIALSAWALIGLGRWFGRQLPLPPARRGRLAQVGSALAAPVLVIAGGMGSWLLFSGVLRFRSIVDSVGPGYLGGALVWAAAAAVASTWLVGRRATWQRVVLVAAIVSGLAVTVAGLRAAHGIGLSVATAPAWFPLSLLSPDGWAAPGQALHPLTALTSQLFDFSALALMCSCFVFAYGAASAEVQSKLSRRR